MPGFVMNDANMSSHRLVFLTEKNTPDIRCAGTVVRSGAGSPRVPGRREVKRARVPCTDQRHRNCQYNTCNYPAHACLQTSGGGFEPRTR
jgi:hypothetical protein